MAAKIRKREGEKDDKSGGWLPHAFRVPGDSTPLSAYWPEGLTDRERLILREALAVAIDEYDGVAVGFGPLVEEAKLLHARLGNWIGASTR